MRKTVPCTYLKFDGTVCNKSCYGGICGQHIVRVPHYPCLGCGRGTFSASGYCATPGPCLLAQRAASARAGNAARKAAKNTSPPVTDEELDSLVDELLDEFIAV